MNDVTVIARHKLLKTSVVTIAATEFLDLAGRPMQHLSQEIVMTAQDMVDGALPDPAPGERVNIPALPNIAGWNSLGSGRKALVPGLSLAIPAPRYVVDSADTR